MLQRKTTSTGTNKKYYYFSQQERTRCEGKKQCGRESLHSDGILKAWLCSAASSAWEGTWKHTLLPGVGTAPTPCTPQHPARSQQSLGGQPCPEEQQLSFPPLSSLKKRGKIGKMESPCLWLAVRLNTVGSLQEFVFVVRGELHGHRHKEPSW